MKETGKIEHSLLRRLREADKAARKLPTSSLPGFAAIGLSVFSSLRRFDYWCTPTNVLSFATTGGDGNHFSFILKDNTVSEHSPVVMTSPSDYDEPNLIVGESLFHFLCLGYHCGFSPIESFPSKESMRLCASARQNQKKGAPLFSLDENERRILDFLIQKLQLSPWRNVEGEIQRLQAEYRPLLKLPEEGKMLDV